MPLDGSPPGRQAARAMTKPRLVPVVAACALALAALVPAADAAPASRESLEGSIRPLDAAAQAPSATLAQRMAHYRVPGLSIAVIADGRIAWSAGYGTRVAGAPGGVDA